MADPRPRTALFFDSGIGGLSVLREARVLMPDWRFIYVADDAAFPYGAWEEGALREHISRLFADLLERYRPALSVIACNTASTLAIDHLREVFRARHSSAPCPRSSRPPNARAPASFRCWRRPAR
jgi:glutamate racemase